VTGNLTVSYTIDSTLQALQTTNSSLYNTLISAANTADQYYMTTYTTATPVSLTYNLAVNTSGVASSISLLYDTDYATYYAGVQATDNAVTANATMKAAAANLAATDPSGAPGGTQDIELTQTEALALGLAGANNTSQPETVTFNSTFNWGVPSNGTIGSNAYDAVGTMEHEVSELMGRSASAGFDDSGNAYGSASNTWGLFNPMDYYRYTATGVVAEPWVAGYNPATQTYFALNTASVNGAQSLPMEVYPNWLPTTTNVAGALGADVQDWDSATVIGDPFGAVAPGVVASISQADVAVMNLLGYQSIGTQCFAAGTRIGLADGSSRAVEDLSPGDTVFTRPGEAGDVVWIGSRHVNCVAHPRPETVCPVRVRRGAFGDNLPHADLFLSPDHAILVDDVLVPARLLVNGSSIASVPRDEITYYHIELPEHAIIRAEGLDVESYLDSGDRANFGNGGRVVRMIPDFMSRLWETEGCAPLVVTGAKLQAARARLSEGQRAEVKAA